MDSNPFPNLKINSSKFLDDIQGRTVCGMCGKSRKYYCYTCYKPLGGKDFESKVPKVKLPIKIDVIKHPQEVDGKSTAVHAAVLAPDQVTVYTYPAIPDYPDKSKVLLVYPGNESVTFEDFVSRTCPVLSSLDGTDVRNEHKELDANLDNADTNRVFAINSELNNPANQKQQSCDSNNHSKEQNNKSLNADQPKTLSENNDNICLKRTLESLTDNEGVEIKKKKKDCGQLYECTFTSVVFIDSTWHSVHKISIDERLKGIQRIELKSQTTKFWRHQQDKPDTYLATVEAIYYFLREYHDKFIPATYNGEYDNLLFYFVFMYGKIRHLYEGGKSLKAYNKKKSE